MNLNTALNICEESKIGPNAQLAWITEKALYYAQVCEKSDELLENKNMLSILSQLGSFLYKPIGSTTIFVDGSCLSNGRPEARAGYAIYVCKDGVDIMKHAYVLDILEPQTNQRAELRALWEALQYCEKECVPNNETATIYTDSMYAMNSLMVWGSDWAARGWRKSDGKPVLHTDILIGMYECLDRIRPFITIKHVEAHTKGTNFVSHGNAIVDTMAKGIVSQELAKSSTVSNALSIQA